MNDLNYNVTFREKDKGWQCIVSYKDKFGKWRQKSKQGFKTKKEAKVYSNVIIKELESKQDLNAELGEITFKEFTNMFLEHISLYKATSTIDLYKYSFNKFKAIERKEMSKITVIDIQSCIDALVREGYSYNTVRKVKTVINTLFISAKDKYNIVGKNIVENVSIKKEKHLEEKHVLTSKELNDLIENTKEYEYKVAFAIAGMSGLRLGEMLGLTWNDIDFDNSVISVNKQWKLLGNNVWGFGELKTQNSYRNVPINSTLIKILKEYKKVNKVVAIDNRLFHWKVRNTAGQRMANKLHRQGYNISIHTLRHTYATLLIQNGVDFKTAAALLGHNVEMTMKIYSHVNNDMLNNAKRVIEKIF